MPKIVRKAFKPFATNASLDQIAQIGSLRNGTPTFSKDPDIVQGLANYTDGWFGIAMGENSPAMEDMNGIQFIFAYMISDILEKGITEWNAQTTYYNGSMVNFNGNIMVSIADNNLNFPLTDATKWAMQGRRVKKVVANYSITNFDDVLEGDSTAAVGNIITTTLPQRSATPIGKQIIIKNVSPIVSAGTVKVQAFAGDFIDEVQTAIDLASGPPVNESITLINGLNYWMIV